MRIRIGFYWNSFAEQNKLSVLFAAGRLNGTLREYLLRGSVVIFPVISPINCILSILFWQKYEIAGTKKEGKPEGCPLVISL